MGKRIRIGCGAGYAGDRIDPAVDLAREGKLDYLVLECLAERTVALAQLEKLRDPAKGYGQLLEERMAALLPYCLENGFKIITNLGAANPEAALEVTAGLAEQMGLKPLKLAALLGADVRPVLRGQAETQDQDQGHTLEQEEQREQVHGQDQTRVFEQKPGQAQEGFVWETGSPISSMISSGRVVSADAYLGAEDILPALQAGADVIITGRVADPSLFLAPMVHEFGWPLDDWERLGQGTVVGHLLECGAQVTGGYFADGRYKTVENLADVGFPLAEIEADGSAVITKLEGSGGAVNLRTCKEQLLYEIHDPSAYLTPDVTADFTGVSLQEVGPDRVRVTGGSGRPWPDTLKVTIGVLDGYRGEGMIGYAGHEAVERARLAREILEKRFARLGLCLEQVRFDLVGLNALHGDIGEKHSPQPYEVMLRVAVKGPAEQEAQKAMQEVEALWVNGPGGPGGIRKQVVPLVAAYSTAVPREKVRPHFVCRELR